MQVTTEWLSPAGDEGIGFWLTDGDGLWYCCYGPILYHLGIKKVQPDERVRFVASPRRPSHSSWSMSQVARRAPNISGALERFAKQAEIAGCHYVWLELRGGFEDGRQARPR